MTRERKKAKQKYFKEYKKCKKTQYYAIAYSVTYTFSNVYRKKVLVKLKPTITNLIEEYEKYNILDLTHRIQAVLSNNVTPADYEDLVFVKNKNFNCKIMSFESDDDALLWYEVDE